MCLMRGVGGLIVRDDRPSRVIENSLGAIPDIGIVQNWGQEEVEQNHHGESIACDVEGSSERVSGVIDLRPVETDG